MRRTGKSKTCVWYWQERYMEEGVDGLLYDATQPPGTPPVAPWKVREVVELTKSPADGEATHWTLRAIAARVGLAFSTARKIRQEHGLVPHRFREFKFSNDPALLLHGPLPSRPGTHRLPSSMASTNRDLQLKERLPPMPAVSQGQ